MRTAYNECCRINIHLSVFVATWSIIICKLPHSLYSNRTEPEASLKDALFWLIPINNRFINYKGGWPTIFYADVNCLKTRRFCPNACSTDLIALVIFSGVLSLVCGPALDTRHFSIEWYFLSFAFLPAASCLQVSFYSPITGVAWITDEDGRQVARQLHKPKDKQWRDSSSLVCHP